MIAVLADAPSTATWALIIGAFVSLSGAVISAGVALRNARLLSSVESRRVTIEEFRTHMDFYEVQIEELRTARERERERGDRLEEQVSYVQHQLELSHDRERKLTGQLVNLTSTVEELRYELTEATGGRDSGAPTPSET